MPAKEPSKPTPPLSLLKIRYGNLTHESFIHNNFSGEKMELKKKCTQKSRKGEMAALCMCLVFSKAHACLISTLDENVDFHIKFFSIKKQYLEIITFCKLVYFRRLVMDIQWVKSLHHEKAPFFVGKYTPPLQKVPRLEFKKIQLF